MKCVALILTGLVGLAVGIDLDPEFKDEFCEPDDPDCTEVPEAYHMHYTHQHGPIQSAVAMNLSSTITLNDGVKMPLFGLGVCCTDARYNREIPSVIAYAMKQGYRLFDTAASYNTEIDTGEAVRESSIPREDLFVVTKLWYENHGRDKAMTAFNQSITNLGLDYVDLYLIHAPYGGKILETYDLMLGLKRRGYVRSVGVSNFGIQHLEGLKKARRPLPSVNQIELHPWQQKKDLVEYCRKEGIAVMGYSPLTRGIKLEDPSLKAIADKYGATTAQLLIRWGVQSGFITIPKSFNERRILMNTKVFDWAIDEEDFEKMNSFPEWSRFKSDITASQWLP